MEKLIIAFLALVLSAAGAQVLAQPISGDKSPKWQTFQSENGELSVERPSNATRFYDKAGFVVSFSKIIFLSSLSGARNRSVFFELMRTIFLPREINGTLVPFSRIIEFKFG